MKASVCLCISWWHCDGFAWQLQQLQGSRCKAVRTSGQAGRVRLSLSLNCRQRTAKPVQGTDCYFWVQHKHVQYTHTVVVHSMAPSSTVPCM